MLEFLFKYGGVLYRLRVGPLANEIDGIADALACTGYARATTRRYLSLAATFSRYAERQHCVRPESIDQALVDRFLVDVPVSEGMRSQARTALGHMLRFLARRFPRKGDETGPTDPDALLLAGFDVHLRDVRGLQPRSREGVLRLARRILTWYRQHRHSRSLADLCGEDVLALVSHILAGCVADGSRSQAVSHVRAFLRYLRWQGVLQEDLARLVPRVACWRMARIPGHLAWSEVRAAIDAIDTTDPLGKRDRAMLLLFATTGLRNQEVRQLELPDIRWRVSELHVRRPKSRRERVLPLLEETGSALADYVLNGRPRVTDATVFLRHRPPIGRLRCSSALSAIVRQRLERCGIRPKRAGAHLIRHSLATRMVQQERSVKEVADLLGHRSIDTTAIYVKVALPQLEEVALPFPGGARRA